ncbi:hypothetical protein AQJ30_15845 [Streptomyces longwoodensis]|uniref:Uncharacterized protein n=1 Tax=Streptomyces longwoodensis TaxID=68231 RepID=A0A117QNA7_9ACTN|nr:hypothetical protein [Streptomyces longwoodensis]KUN37753.1 hypothetical protein AQJ30_15845 [Streptomyces longwoodensis]
MRQALVEVSDERIMRALLAADDVSNRAVARQLGIRDESRVARVRRQIGLPPYVRGRRPLYRSVREAFERQSEPVEGGHRRWTGTREANGTPVVRYLRRIDTAYRVAFRLHYRREPVGYLSRSCNIPGCVEGAHQVDRAMREAQS